MKIRVDYVWALLALACVAAGGAAAFYGYGWWALLAGWCAGAYSGRISK